MYMNIHYFILLVYISVQNACVNYGVIEDNIQKLPYVTKKYY